MPSQCQTSVACNALPHGDRTENVRKLCALDCISLQSILEWLQVLANGSFVSIHCIQITLTVYC